MMRAERAESGLKSISQSATRVSISLISHTRVPLAAKLKFGLPACGEHCHFSLLVWLLIAAARINFISARALLGTKDLVCFKLHTQSPKQLLLLFSLVLEALFDHRY
jgi:hypothetical protein